MGFAIMKLFSPLSIILFTIAVGLLVFFAVRTHDKKTADIPVPVVTSTPAVIPDILVGATLLTEDGIGNAPTTSAEANKGDKAFLATLVRETAPKDPDLKQIQLGVPMFKQQYKNSCEEASLRMALAYYGIQTDDMAIVQQVGYNPKAIDAKNIWDNPYQMYVGNINTKNGYGTFAPPIAKAAVAFGRKAQSYSMVTAPFIAQQIAKGYPVIIWGFFRTPPYLKYNWNTVDGTKITAYRGEHVRVITGILGDPLDPTGFYINDPLTGADSQYWSAERLMTHMNMWGALTNQAVVVK
ncbi:MAG: hypothetical protein JWM20_779 [Patescibacteria group bacterium]|nr:hypothetical protein [Patescibacteria group bacterium]